VEIEPGYADAQDNLGIALLQTGKVDEAIPHFQKAVELKPDFGDAQENLGIALLQTGKADEATPHLLRALEADPKQAQAYYNLGGALFVQGKVKEALARWREGLRQDPNNLPLFRRHQCETVARPSNLGRGRSKCLPDLTRCYLTRWPQPTPRPAASLRQSEPHIVPWISLPNKMRSPSWKA
jgi:tetratricopeptide (TPR) repeat protein